MDIISPNIVRYIDEQVALHGTSDPFMRRHMDADLTLTGVGTFFKRELEYVFRVVLEANVPPPNGLRLFPISTEVTEGATSYTHRMMEPTGEAQIITSWGEDLPRVNVTLREESKDVKYLGDAYTYTLLEIMAARMANRPIDQLKAMAAREAMERKHNRLLWFGDTEAGLFGVLRHPFIPRFAFANPISSATPPEDIVDEMNAWINSVSAVNETAIPPASLTMVLPNDEYSHITSTPRSATSSSDTTIASFLLANNPWLREIEAPSWECAPDRNNGTGLGVLYQRNMPNKAKYVSPIVFRQQPVQTKNLEFVINCLGGSGGFYTPYPLEMSVAEFA